MGGREPGAGRARGRAAPPSDEGVPQVCLLCSAGELARTGRIGLPSREVGCCPTREKSAVARLE